MENVKKSKNRGEIRCVKEISKKYRCKFSSMKEENEKLDNLKMKDKIKGNSKKYKIYYGRIQTGKSKMNKINKK